MKARCSLCGSKNPAECPCRHFSHLAVPVRGANGGFRWEPRPGVPETDFERGLDRWLEAT